MNYRAFAITLILGVTHLMFAEEPPVRIYLANDDHTDYLWTADAETYHRVFVEMLDYYLRLTDETLNNPPPYQSRFNADGSFWLWQYERRKSPAEFDRLMGRLKEGYVSAPMTTLVSCYGGQPLEAVLRGLYYAGRLERRFGVRFSLAVAMENQTLPLGLASLWAGAGARYSWRGVCACASRLPAALLQRRPHEIYWQEGHDGQRVLMKWHSLAAAGNQHSGGYAEAFDPAAAIRFLSSDAEFLRHYRAPGAAQPYAVRGAFGFGWDALDRKTGQPYLANPTQYPLTDHFHQIAREQSSAERQVIVSNEEDFFRDFEAHYGTQLPAERLTYGNEWELYSASMAETSARVKRAVEKLRAAELMAVLVGLHKPSFLSGREGARDLAFTDLGLYWEHDWTADGPISRNQRAAWQERLAHEIEDYVNSLHTDAAAQLGGLIQNSNPGSQRFYVLNPLGWVRTDYADFPYSGSQNIHVRDLEAGLDTPHQFIQLNGRSFLRVLAREIPSAGYKSFEICSGPGTAPTNAAAQVGSHGATLENSMVGLTLEADGAISSLIDKSSPERELAAGIRGLFLNDFAANQSQGNPIQIENSGPVSVTLKCVSQVEVPHTTRITLVRDSNRIEIRNEITGNFTNVRHWAFSFNLSAPTVHTEEIGAVICAKYKSAGGDYADTHGRYDYLTLNHFADMSDGANRRGVTLANADCAFVRLGGSTPSTLDTSTPQLHVLAGGQVDGPGLGIHAQNGATYFLQRFALKPHGPYDPVAAMKFGLEMQNPLITSAVTGSTSSPYPAHHYSLLKIDHPAVMLWALKPHEDGIDQGVVVRVWNLASSPSRIQFTTPAGIAKAQRVTHIETPLESLSATNDSLESAVDPHRMESYTLNLRR